ncbi:DNA-binding transcriptional regulator, XRE-family HTH domain [Lacrimispora sphenoides]|uniref:helix-turn-helix domain-containing protein n=1 Tax=Lacrimispora sphenoides TaxID=29370 RepID=UPI0008C41538|nr:helix-turn-helix transcriptional regulator [Lacrimispora sphenoides]SEU22489.1 DNA-binding transcriptional regulator, XRE-family HTH domain [Lacrimispora sphenoides]
MDFNVRQKEVGSRIKNLREKRGESQTELGEAIGLSQNSISKIENGETQLTLENQYSIAEHYNVSHDYICTGKNDDSILSLLEKYVSLKYANTSDGIETFEYPVLKIDKVLFDYLVHVAHARNTKGVPDDVRELWIEREISSFYERNKNNAHNESEAIVSMPEQLIYPDEQKQGWKQSDLLREMNKQLLDNSNTKGE